MFNEALLRESPARLGQPPISPSPSTTHYRRQKREGDSHRSSEADRGADDQRTWAVLEYHVVPPRRQLDSTERRIGGPEGHAATVQPSGPTWVIGVSEHELRRPQGAHLYFHAGIAVVKDPCRDRRLGARLRYSQPLHDR
jgi:hypothetical protein